VTQTWPGSAGETAIRETHRPPERSSRHEAPRSRVTQIRPSSVPTYTVRPSYAGPIVVMVPNGYASGPGPPVRSGLITDQVTPPSVERFSRLPPVYSTAGLRGSSSIGVNQFRRSETTLSAK
jgi:hypothetical protein